MKNRGNQWPDPAIASVEERALERLLMMAVDNGPLGPTSRYGRDLDQVYETVGARDEPVLVLVHGGFFRPNIDRIHLRPLARAVASLGWQVVLAEYRRVPGQPLSSVADLHSLEEHLRATGRAPSRIVGHSAGGLLVLLRALSPTFYNLPPTEIVALAAVSDPVRAATESLGRDAVQTWIGAQPQEQPQTYLEVDPTQLVKSGRRTRSKVHLVHGRSDATVPCTHTEALVKMARYASNVCEDGSFTDSWKSALPEAAHHFDLVDPAELDTATQPWWRTPATT